VKNGEVVERQLWDDDTTVIGLTLKENNDPEMLEAIGMWREMTDFERTIPDSEWYDPDA